MTVSTPTTSGQILTSAYVNNNINSGLVYIKEQTIGSAVSSVTVSGAFSTDYDNYLIKIVGGVLSTTAQFYLRFGATVSGYKWQLLYGSYNSTPGAEGTSSGTEIRYAGNGDTTGFDAHIEVMSPFLAKNTKTISSEFSSGDVGSSFGVVPNTTSYTAFTILPNSGTITGGTITVYGYRKA
jgi:hypothetical protein